MASRWRRWNTAIHRDLGYLCAGLTLVYALSGVAVNHRADWNPSYRITSRTVAVTVGDGMVAGRGRAAGAEEREVAAVLDALGIPGPVRGTFRPDASTLEIFVEGGAITVDLDAGEARFDRVRERTGLRQANYLHLNQPKRWWTWMADLYALALVVLAVTGLFVLRGRNGITGRGAWLTALGVAVPVGFLLLYL
jgi:hypothetical protein